MRNVWERGFQGNCPWFCKGSSLSPVQNQDLKIWHPGTWFDYTKPKTLGVKRPLSTKTFHLTKCKVLSTFCRTLGPLLQNQELTSTIPKMDDCGMILSQNSGAESIGFWGSNTPDWVEETATRIISSRMYVFMHLYAKDYGAQNGSEVLWRSRARPLPRQQTRPHETWNKRMKKLCPVDPHLQPPWTEQCWATFTESFVRPCTHMHALRPTTAWKTRLCAPSNSGGTSRRRKNCTLISS